MAWGGRIHPCLAARRGGDPCRSRPPRMRPARPPEGSAPESVRWAGSRPRRTRRWTLPGSRSLADRVQLPV